ncbi:MAG: class I SAM-dependent methyltransferase [Firmicutes bacterium]|nr:class I SAM-dependent methyltransferase [Bacillota bacterium]
MTRLDTIFSLIEQCDIFADIGTDHGLIAKAALAFSKKVIASDISEKCLEKAKKLLQASENTEFIVSDGLKNFNENPCIISICGMGGHTIKDILTDYFSKNKTAILILQPQNDVHLLREFLVKNNYTITHDVAAREKKKFYCILKAVPGVDKLDSQQILFGKFYKHKSLILKEKLQYNLARLKTYTLFDGKITQKNEDLINLVKEALTWQE